MTWCESGVVVRIMREDHWEAIEKALCLAGEHLDSSIQEVEATQTALGFMKNRLIVDGLRRDREMIRRAHLNVRDDRTIYGTMIQNKPE